MGGARRRLRRQARQAAKQLIKAGVSTTNIGEFADLERDKRFLGKIVEAAEKRIDGGEGSISIREGLAAVKERRELRRQQLEIADREPEPEGFDPEPEVLPRAEREIAAPDSAQGSNESRAAANNAERAA